MSTTTRNPDPGLGGAAFLQLSAPFLAAVCAAICAVFLLVFVASSSAGGDSSAAGVHAMVAVLGCSACSSAFSAFAKLRCPNGCKNVLLGPDT